MAKKQSLGKGLDLIFDDNTVESGGGVTYISLTSIAPKKNQPRKYFDMDALSDLAASIAAHGVLQPILVRDLKNGTYEIIAGERRFRASKLAGLSEVPCIVMDADEVASSEVALIENIQREDLNPYEEAMAYKSLSSDFGLSQEEISKIVGKSRSAIANSMRLLDLPEEVIDFLLKGTLSAGHCRALLGLIDRSEIVPLAQRAAKKNLSVREVETAVRKLNRRAEEEEKEEEDKGVFVDYKEDLERRVMALSGRRVKISGTNGHRTVRIDCTDDEDLENLLSAICGRSIIEEQ